MGLVSVGNVFYFVVDLDAAVAWYGDRLGREAAVRGGALVAFELDGVRLTLHRADEYNSPGPAGTSPYGPVGDVDDVLAERTAHGVVAHRGAKTVFTG